MKNTDTIITNCALIKQKKASLCDFCFLLFLLFAIRRRLKSHFKNLCFVFYRAFQTLTNNNSPRPDGRAFISFLVFGNLGKTLALVIVINPKTYRY